MNRALAKTALLVSVWIAVSVPDVTAQASGTVIVANMSDNTVTIFDVADEAVIATLPTGIAPHEIAVSDAGDVAVVTNYGNRNNPGNTLTVVDLDALEVRQTIDLGVYQRPHGIAFLAGDSTVAVTSESAGLVLIVAVNSGTIVKTLPTTQRVSHMLASAHGGDRLFTTNIVDGTVTVLNPDTEDPLKVVSVAPMVEGIASAPNGESIWVGSNQRKTVSVVDVEAGLVVDSLTGFGFPYRMAISPNGSLVVISDPMLGEIRIVDALTRTEQHRIKVSADNVLPSAEFSGSPAPEGIALSRDGQWAYVALQGRNEVGVVNLENGEVVSYLPAGGWPDGIGYSPVTR